MGTFIEVVMDIDEQARELGFNPDIQSAYDQLTEEQLWSLLERESGIYMQVSALVNKITMRAAGVIESMKESD